MKIDLGNYKYCEDSELEELGTATNKKTVYKYFNFNVNGTLFKTELGNYVFHGCMRNQITKTYILRGWNLIDEDLKNAILSCCDHVNEINKFDILPYEKV